MQKFPNSLNDIKIKPFSGMTISELTAVLEHISGEKDNTYRAKQIFSWICRGSLSFNNMTNLPQALRSDLQNQTLVRGSILKKKLIDPDGTIKLVLELCDGAVIETVLLAAENNRRIACLSVQAGCPMGCVFCKTGFMGFLRNLEAFEIADQFLFLSDELAEQSKIKQIELRISHIVIMGMGEPLLNINPLRKVLEILCDPAGFGISKRKICISTSGIYKGIIDLAENGPAVELAFSIVSAREELRRSLMPGTINDPLSSIKKALILYKEKQGRRLTLETVLLGGINTTSEDARALLAFAADLDLTVNIIPWNPAENLFFNGKKLCRPETREIQNFSRLLKESGLRVTQRYRRGRSINGACGQLGETLRNLSYITDE